MKKLNHKGFVGDIQYSAEDEVFHGKIEGIDGLVTFEAPNIEDLRKAFEDAVDYYLLFVRRKFI